MTKSVTLLLLIVLSLPALDTFIPPSHADQRNAIEASKKYSEFEDQIEEFFQQANYAEAIPLALRQISLSERAFGKDHVKTADSIRTLANLFMETGRSLEAEPLYRRALEIFNSHHGENSLESAGLLHDLALSLHDQGRFSESAEIYRRSVDIQITKSGAKEPSTLQSTFNLASVLHDAGAFEEAEELYQFVLANADEATKLWLRYPRNYAVLLIELERYQSAIDQIETLLVDGLEQSVDFEDATTYHHLAYAQYRLGRTKAALSSIRKSTDILTRRWQAASSTDFAELVKTERRNWLGNFFGRLGRRPMLQLELINDVQRQEGVDSALSLEALQVSQIVSNSSAGRALAEAAARRFTSDGKITALIRERQELTQSWLKSQTEQANSLRGFGGTNQDQSNLQNLEKRIAEIDGQLAKDDSYSSYLELVSAQAAEFKDLRASLNSTEAIIVFLTEDTRSLGEKVYFFIIRSNLEAPIFNSIDFPDLDANVLSLRNGLKIPSGTSFSGLPFFDLSLSRKIYTKLFDDISPHLDGIEHLYLVPDGPLEQLPFNALASSLPPEPIDNVFRNYRTARYLSDDFTLSILPNLNALVINHPNAEAQSARRELLSFGAPEHNQKQVAAVDANVTINLGGSPQSYSQDGTSKDGKEAFLVALPPIPSAIKDTLVELNRRFGADPANLFIGKEASENRLRDLSDNGKLATYDNVIIASHGLLASEMVGTGLTEPTLVLTPEQSRQAEGDGFLTTTEIVSLDFLADWIILSACNTAGSDGTLGEGSLSGLSRAFLFAGANDLLVSHWPAEASATAELVSDALIEISDKKITKPEAVRMAMQKLRANTSKPHFAHPALWAPFTVVGGKQDVSR